VYSPHMAKETQVTEVFRCDRCKQCFTEGLVLSPGSVVITKGKEAWKNTSPQYLCSHCATNPTYQGPRGYPNRDDDPVQLDDKAWESWNPPKTYFGYSVAKGAPGYSGTGQD